MNHLVFNVLIEGESTTFLVQLRRDIEVCYVKDAILENRPMHVNGPDILELWKVDVDLSASGTDTHSLARLEAKQSGQPLMSWRMVSDYWPSQPSSSHLHIMVRIPATEEGDFEHLKRSTLAATAPSTIARPSQYENLQENASERILDNRPDRDMDIPPIPLLYDGFGHFLDVFHGHVPDMSFRQLHTRVDAFAEKMCDFYPTDDDRRAAGLTRLERIFKSRTGCSSHGIQPDVIDSAGMNFAGSSMEPQGVVSIFKNWPANGGAMPEVELVASVARLQARSPKHELIGRWRIPFLGLTIVGHEIRFYAIILLGHQYRIVSLTPGLSCDIDGTDGWERKLLYNAFAAALVLQTHISQDTQNSLTRLPPKIPNGTHHFPAISKLPKWQSSDSVIHFQITSLYDTGLLYAAHTLGGGGGADSQTPILVKFVKRYSVDLHDFCARRGHAPQILGFGTLPGGWYAIAMEFIESAIMITASRELDAHRERWTKELLELVDGFHQHGFVHGDLRDANILCVGDKVMLIDFDFGGREGEAIYPCLDLSEDILDGRLSTDCKIMKEDDKRVLTRTLARL